ncbi:MAG: ABC transporter ATP-binding protein [Candidatus Bathyarchaeales archaeon]
MPNVKVVNVSKTFGDGKIVAVDNVSLEIYDKEYFSLIGPSGCGKTTLLRLIAGLIPMDKGDIYIDNVLVNNLPPEEREIGFVFQTYALFPHMNVWENVTYGPHIKAWEEKKASALGRETLEMVKLYERSEAFPNELSGGMMQRVAVARALAAGAKLLLLDEPLGALDAKIRNELRYDIRRLVKDLGLTAIHVTHDQAEAMAISDRIAVMRKGKILQVGTPYDLYMNPQHLFVANFIGESNFLEGHIVDVQQDFTTVKLRGGITVDACNAKTRKKDERVVIAVRPEAFTMQKGWKKIANGITGTIKRVSFEGTTTRYEVYMKTGNKVIVTRPSLAEQPLPVNEKVTLAFQPEKSHVFPYPLLGLMEELKSE